MPDFLSIVASLLTIISAALTIYAVSSSLKESVKNEKIIHVQIEQISKQKGYRPEEEEEAYLIEIIKSSYVRISKTLPSLLLYSALFSLSLMLYSLSSESSFFSAITDRLVRTYSIDELVASLIVFLYVTIAASVFSFLVLSFLYDSSLRLQLRNLGLTTGRLIKIRNYFHRDQSVSNYRIYPIDTLSDALENLKVKQKNRRIKSGRLHRRRWFWENWKVWFPVLVLLLIYFLV